MNIEIFPVSPGCRSCNPIDLKGDSRLIAVFWITIPFHLMKNVLDERTTKTKKNTESIF